MLILGIIISIFLVLGFGLPFFNEEFNDGTIEESTADVSELMNDFEAENNARIESGINSHVTFWTVFLSVGKMFFWTFGSIPLWLDLTLFTLLRTVFWLTIARNMWVGGGS